MKTCFITVNDRLSPEFYSVKQNAKTSPRIKSATYPNLPMEFERGTEHWGSVMLAPEMSPSGFKKPSPEFKNH